MASRADHIHSEAGELDPYVPIHPTILCRDLLELPEDSRERWVNRLSFNELKAVIERMLKDVDSREHVQEAALALLGAPPPLRTRQLPSRNNPNSYCGGDQRTTFRIQHPYPPNDQEKSAQDTRQAPRRQAPFELEQATQVTIKTEENDMSSDGVTVKIEPDEEPLMRSHKRTNGYNETVQRKKARLGPKPERNQDSRRRDTNNGKGRDKGDERISRISIVRPQISILENAFCFKGVGRKRV